MYEALAANCYCYVSALKFDCGETALQCSGMAGEHPEPSILAFMLHHELTQDHRICEHCCSCLRACTVE